MAISNVSVPEETFRGVRPLNFHRDATQVVRLLNLVFGPSMAQEGQPPLDSHAVANGAGPLMGRLAQLTQRMPPGFVWEDEQRIVGNISVLPSTVAGRYLIANVAVHPSYRRQGIARQLLDAAIETVQRERGRGVYLQVRDDNEGAIALYERRGFHCLGSMTRWQLAGNKVRPIDSGETPFTIRPLRGHEWEAAIQLDWACCHPDLDWPTPVPYGLYKTGLWRWFYNLMNGRQEETWAASHQGTLVAVGQIAAELGQPHHLRLRIRPDWREPLSRPLLGKLVRRLGYLRYRTVVVHHRTDDETMTALLAQAGFRASPSLSTMKLTV